jgi:ribosomal-protein-alanine N-acetyltransferase
VSRVHLAAISEADRQEFLAAMRASVDLHRPWLWPALTDLEFDAVLERCAREEFETLIARRRRDHALVGYFSVSNIIRGALQSAFLGYGANAAYAGQGYMSEALALVLDQAFGPLGLHRLEANIQPANRRSLALVRRAGFRREGLSPRYLRIAGQWRDHERWAILAEEWRSRRRS